MSSKLQKIVFWGTFDKGKPRVRLLLEGAKSMGLEVIECHSEIWQDVADKSQLSGLVEKAKRFINLCFVYPVLIYRYLRLPPHDLVFIGYMGQIDVLVIWLFARLRNVPICWDVFLCLYDTVVIDRKIVSKKSIVAILLYSLEWLASRIASQLILDTRTYAAYFEKLYHLEVNSVCHVFVGAELDKFKGRHVDKKSNERFTVLFYGQFIPLHGIDTIVHAAKIIEESGKDVRWILIGRGQEQAHIDQLIDKIGIKSMLRIPWVPYERLIEYINAADICLGIFGSSGKASRVIPNKVYQILAAGKPLITGNSPAIRELLVDGPTVRLVEPGNPEALASAVCDFCKMLKKSSTPLVPPNPLPLIGPIEVGRQLVPILEKCIQ